MSPSSSTVSKAAYEFKYFPRHGRWTPGMQAELDAHSRRMAELMMHVQDMYKSKEQISKDQRKEDTVANCIGFPISSRPSSGFPPRGQSTSRQSTHGHSVSLVQYNRAQRAALLELQSRPNSILPLPTQKHFAPMVLYNNPAQRAALQRGYYPMYY